MMEQLVKISTVFNIYYGHQLDLNKQVILKNHGISFVNRTANNLGVSCKIQRIPNIQPFKKGLITVSLGGSVLESYIQPEDFYTGQNVKVLEPKTSLSYNQKLFYCLCIKRNAYKYSAFGREANKTFNDLLVPNVLDIPKWVEDIKLPKEPSRKPFHSKKLSLSDIARWDKFKLFPDFFDMKAGKYYAKDKYKNGSIPLISSSKNNNGVMFFTDIQPKFSNCITIGKVEGYAFFQKDEFVASSDVTVLVPKFKMSDYIAIFLISLLNKECYKWSYGRQIRLNDCKKLSIKLPVKKDNKPDWQFMESYIKSLPYSSSL